MTMFEYTKMILEKVSFEPRLFRKEFRKAVRFLSPDEFKQLLTWGRNKFGRRNRKMEMSNNF